MANKAKNCPSCDWQQASWQKQCEYCGHVFEDAASAEAAEPSSPPAQLEEAQSPAEPAGTLYEPAEDELVIEDKPPLGERFKAAIGDIFFPEPVEVNAIEVGGRIALLALMAYAGVSALAMSVHTGEMANSWLHLLHLIFHEAGHMIFAIFGRFMGTAGGTIMQLLMPFLFVLTFLFKFRNAFGAAASLWWVAHSSVDIAPYAWDARAQKLILLGGVTGQDVPGYHDWHNMLSKLQWLEHDHTIARVFWWGGALLMAVAWLWGAALVLREVQRLLGGGRKTPLPM